MSLVAALAGAACGGGKSAAVTADDGGGSATLSSDVFAPWWSPTCKTSGDKCTDPSCSPSTFLVYATRCGPAQTIMTGCLPTDRTVDGWGCYLHASDGEVIFTEDIFAMEGATLAQYGFESCYEAGVTNGFGAASPYCPNGASQ